VPGIADLLGVASHFSHEGKTYQLREPTQLEQGKFTRWLEQRAREAVFRATDMDPAQQERAERAVTRDIASCVYEWNGEASLQAQLTPLGMARLVYIVLSTEHPEVTPEVATAMVDTRMREVAAIMVGANASPKAQRDVCRLLTIPLSTLKPKSSSSGNSSSRRSTKRRRKSKA
jgi:hypothetical protein